nr:hypothetical protein [Tanacetum cinerariifolium]
MQERHPISFFSRAISPRQSALSVYEKELLAIMMAVKQWHYYLITSPFVIRTDQRSLKHLLTQKVTTPLQYKWLAKLIGYDYVIEYKKGRENVAADALSRVQRITLFTTAISQIEPLLFNRILDSQNNVVEVQQVIQKLKEGEILPRFKWNGRWLALENHMAVGGNTELHEEIVKLCHESPMGGHSGVNDTVQRRAKHENVPSPGLLQPLPIPDTIFTDISMDFIGGLPKVKGKDTIFVVVDRLTKYAHFMVLGHPFSAKDVAQVFLDNIYKLHACPNSINSDRDPIFLSSFWTEFLKLQGVSAKLDVADHDVDEMMQDREAAIKVLKQSLIKAQNHMKQQADKHRTERAFESGSWGPTIQDHSNSKEARFSLQPSAVLDQKLVKRRNRAAVKVLVQWKGQTTQDATWEFLDELKLRFPDFSELTSCGQEVG